MTAFLAIFKREVKSYFSSPIAFVIITMFLVIIGIFFAIGMNQYAKMSLQVLQQRGFNQSFNATQYIIQWIIQLMSTVFLFLSPLLTMRMFSEERKNGTIELMLTYPVRDIDVVAGKFCAAMVVALVMIGGTWSVPGFVSYLSTSIPTDSAVGAIVESVKSAFLLTEAKDPEVGVVFTGYLGIILLSASMISLGMFCSSLTENQIVAAVLTFGATLILWIIGAVKQVFGGVVGEVFEGLSILSHYENFSKGILDSKDLIFYVSFIFFFIFATLRSIESYRWRG